MSESRSTPSRNAPAASSSLYVHRTNSHTPTCGHWHQVTGFKISTGTVPVKRQVNASRSHWQHAEDSDSDIHAFKFNLKFEHYFYGGRGHLQVPASGDGRPERV